MSDENNQDTFEHHSFLVDPKQETIRIDKYLMERIPSISRTRIQAIAKEGLLLVNKEPVKQNYKVHPHDSISVNLPYQKTVFELVPENIPINVVYEDEDVAIINKPAEMVVHPGHGNYEGTLLNGLIYHFNNLPQRDDYFGRPGLVHRIDKNTSGLLVVAKNENALTNLAAQFAKRTSERRYHALVWGDLEEDKGTITGNIARSKKNRKVYEVYPDEEEFGKHAVTHYTVIERLRYVTLIECKLETGRTHQIRVHLKHIGHPLFNDHEYGGNRILKGTTFTKYKQFIDNCFKLIPGQALHAKTLGFKHPKTNKWMSFNSELPEGFEQLLNKWRVYSNSHES